MCSQIKQILSLKMTPIVLKLSDVWEAIFCLKIGLHLQNRGSIFQAYLFTITLTVLSTNSADNILK